MSRTSPRERAVSTTDYEVVRGSRGGGGGREGEAGAAGRVATDAGAGIWDGKTWDFPAALRFEIADVVADQIETIGDLMRVIEGRDLTVALKSQPQAPVLTAKISTRNPS